MRAVRVGRFIVVAALALAAIPGVAAADPPDQQPLVFNTTLTPDALPSQGGSVTVTAEVIEDVGLQEVYADVVGSDGSYQKVPMSIQSGDVFDGVYAGTFDLPANTTASAVTYTVTAWALDTNAVFGGDPAGEVTVAPPLSAGLLTARPGKVSFGTVRIGDVRQRTVMVRNRGARNVAPIDFVVGAGGPFTVVSASHLTLKPRERAAVTIEYRPTSAGVQDGALFVMRADGGQPQLAVPLRGRAKRR